MLADIRFMGTSRQLRTLVTVLFFFSGLTALVYQIVWARLLMLAFGASAFAVAAVLMAFMGGMTAGAMAAGRVVDRRTDQLRIYALLEFVIAGYALVLPSIIAGMSWLYVWVYQQFSPEFYVLSLLRLIVSISILLVPTAAMGATLPLLCSLVAQDRERASHRTALLYGINTLGGIVGCLGAGFILIPMIGLAGTTWAAVLGNAVIGVVALMAARMQASAPTPATELTPGPQRPPRRAPGPIDEAAQTWITVVIAVTALSGFTAMIYETLWTRVLSMVIGGTVYAFTTMLAAFLSGLALGSLLHAWKPSGRPGARLAACQVGIGLWVLLMTPHFDHLPFALLKVFELTQDNWALFQFLRFLLLFGVLVVPTTLFGLSFPLAVQLVVRRDGETGSKIGLLYGLNTIGNVAGAFVGGFVLIPFVGLQPGLVIAATVNIFAAMLLVAMDPQRRPAVKAYLGGALAAAAMVAVLIMSPWNLSYLNSGAYVYARYYNGLADLKATLQEYEPVFYQEGATGTVAVLRAPDGTLSLTIDGKTDASTGQNADMATQMLLSHLPALFVDEPADALLVGLGSGVSLGSLLRHEVRSVDVLEISPGVVEASHYFREYNHDPLGDARVRLMTADGRHHLERTDRHYDLIISEPSNPWITGVSNLFTREYYQLMARRLNHGGIACQWVPSYHMSQETLGIVCKTFSDVFPHSSLWTSTAVGDLFLIGSAEPLRLSYRAVAERLGRPAIREDLDRVGLGDPTLLARTFKYCPSGLETFLDSFDTELPINTDLHPVLEFQTPRFLLCTRVARDFRHPADLKGDLEGLTSILSFVEEKNRLGFVEAAAGYLAAGDPVDGQAP